MLNSAAANQSHKDFIVVSWLHVYSLTDGQWFDLSKVLVISAG